MGDDLLDLLSNKLQPVSKFAFCIYIRTRVFPNVLESAGVLTPMPLNLTVLSLKVLTNNKCKYLNNIIFVMLDPAALFWKELSELCFLSFAIVHIDRLKDGRSAFNKSIMI